MSLLADNPHIIGLAGSFGSGCTYITDHILVKAGYSKLSLSATLKQLYVEKFGKPYEHRQELQAFGDSIREDHGPDFLAEKAIETIHASEDNRWVVDSIRNPAEIRKFRDYSTNFYLMGVYADKATRWRRVKDGYNDYWNEFEQDDQRDAGKNSPKHGQRVSDCFYEADIVLRNEGHINAVGNTDFEEFAARVRQVVGSIQMSLTNQQVTRPDEAMMAMAYAASQRSSCLQRKVGAIITDGNGSIISSGFNEVPPGEKPCKDEHTKCYRKVHRDSFFDCLRKIIPEFKDKYESAVEGEFKERFRVLDLCRALHAEENAILSLARHGRSALAEECTLYTTTYPCRMCANKIAQLGIKRVVYLEPYPDDEAKAILVASDVTTEFFEGIAFRAYFRVYGDKR